MRYFITFLMVLLSGNTSAEDLLKGYNTTKPSHTMQCWKDNAMTKYEIIGGKIYVNNQFNEFDTLQNQGNIFAGKKNVSEFFGDLTLILDYDQKKFTRTSRFGTEVFDCN